MPRDGLLRRWRRRRLDPATFVPLPDSHPRRGLISEPVRIERLEVEHREVSVDGEWVSAPAHSDPSTPRRITFLIEIRSADDARCPNVAVEARIAGPERERTVSGATDLLGRVRFRMIGPSGSYRCEVLDVAAGGLDWDREAGPTTIAAGSLDGPGPA
jgi:hypothetical protein